MKRHEVCQRTGLTVKTVRFYESQGLIHPATEERNGKTWRDYSEEDVARLLIISELRRALFPIAEIGRMLDNPRQVPELLAAHRVKIEKMYSELGELRTALEQAEQKQPAGADELATALAESGAALPLPAIDLSPRFKELDAEEAKRIPPPGPVRPKVFTKGVLIFAAVLLLTGVLLAVFRWRSISSFEYRGETFRRVERQTDHLYSLILCKGEDGSELVVWDHRLEGWGSLVIPNRYANDPERKRAAIAIAESLGVTGLRGDAPELQLPYLLEGLYTRADGLQRNFVLLGVQPKVYFSREDSLKSQLLLYEDGTEIASIAGANLWRLFRLEQTDGPGLFREEGMNSDASEIVYGLLWAADLRNVTNHYLGYLLSAFVIVLLVIGARVLVPSVAGISSKNKGEQMLGYATLYGAGGVALGGKHTEQTVYQSPMEASVVLQGEEEKKFRE